MASEAWENFGVITALGTIMTEVLALREEVALLKADLKANPLGKS